MGDFPEGLRSVEVNGAALSYLDRGTGEAVVFVHGTSQDLRTWLHQLDAVAARHRVLDYSRRFARPNEDIPPGQDDQMQPHVNDLCALLGALNAAPAHLVGSSWGGFICLLTAIQRPDLVRSLVLCEPPVLPLFITNNPRPPELIRLLIRRPVDAVRIARFGLGVVEPTAKAYREGNIERGAEIFGKALVGDEGLRSMPTERKRMLDENQAAEIAQMLGDGFPPLRSADVRAVQTPTLLVAGERSPAVLRLTLINELARLLPNSTKEVIPGASHLMHEENPLAFNEALLAFLGEVHPQGSRAP